MKKREERRSRYLRSQIRTMLAEGVAISKIAKVLGIGYAHAKNLAEQEQTNEQS